MNRKIYKLKFETGVHFGNGSLADSENTFQADTLFSALCIEALKMGGEEMINKLVSVSKAGSIKISDAFPYIENTLFIPKPFMPLEVEKENKSNSKEKKAYKKLKYLPVSSMNKYLTGKLDVIKVNKDISMLGVKEERTLAAVRGREDAEPYHLGVFKFAENAGLYIIAEFRKNEHKKLFDQLFSSLSYTGIGGKVSSGLGRFKIEEVDVPKELEKRLDKAEDSKCRMSLSVCIPKDNEMDEALENAFYKVEKRSGFVASSTYADSLMKKKDLYVIQAGGCFEKGFEGRIVDVSINGAHPVYRYAKPLFMEVI